MINNLRSDGAPIILGKRIGKGGEGEVYILEGTGGYAVKVYTVDNLTDRQLKISNMISAGLAGASQLVAFPIKLVTDEQGRFRGFIMRQVVGHKPLFELFGPGARKRNFPKADYRFLVRTATNISRAIAAVHASGCVIGDINHSGVLISDQATASLIDADSFQFVRGNERFLCRVGVPEYTPPELQGKKLNNIERTSNHDAFGLAVIIFQLLFFGRHPFSGTYAHGDLTQQEAIQQCRFAYSNARRVDMTPPPGAPILSNFPNPMQAAFEAAFGPTNQRPTANHWVALLAEFERSLSRCGSNKMHYFWSGNSSCPWCEIDLKTGAQLFCEEVPRSAAPVSFVTVFSEFDQVSIVPFTFTQPPAANLLPSERAKQSKTSNGSLPLSKIIFWGGVAVLFGAPMLKMGGLSIVGILMMIFSGAADGPSKEDALKASLLNELRALDGKIDAAVSDWFQRSGLMELYRQKAELDALKSEVNLSAGQFSPFLAEVKKHRHQIALHEYLERHFIRKASLSGINQSLVNTLASYGIETAADVKKKPHVKVPGIGPQRTKTLNSWVNNLEGRFVFKNDLSLEKKEELLVRAQLDKHLNSLLGEFDQGLQRLKLLNSQATTKSRAPRGFDNLFSERKQIAVDLEFLGQNVPPVNLKIPSIPRAAPKNRRIEISVSGQAISISPTISTSPQSSPAKLRTGIGNQPASPPRAPVTPRTTQSASPTCPRCNGRMVVRVARRGRNAGGSFWGCTNYPRCKGTRPI